MRKPFFTKNTLTTLLRTSCPAPKVDSSSTDVNPQFLRALWKLQKVILNSLDFERVTQTVCDVLLRELDFSDLGYKIVVLSLIDERKNTLERVAVSQTEEAQHALQLLPLPFSKISIPMSCKNNIMVKSVESQKVLLTHDWYDLMTPAISDKVARTTQLNVGIKTSLIYPISVNDKVIGVMIFSLSKHLENSEVSEAQLLSGFVDIVGLSVQNADLYRKLKNNSDKLKRLNIKLKELDELKDEFVSLASHELRTPMVSIRNYIWLVLNGKAGEINPKMREYLNRAYDSASRLSRLVNGMLNISRIESGRIILTVTHADMNQVIRESFNELHARADKVGIKLVHHQKVINEETGREVKLPSVLVDVDKIKEVIVNLVGNSLKFTPKGGHIDVAVSVVDKDTIKIAVTDTGVGLTEDQIPQLFKKFGMIRESYVKTSMASGSGLGLYVSKAIVELHGGKIWVTSPGKDQGATFFFTVPVYSAQLQKAFADKTGDHTDAGIIPSALTEY